MSSEFRKKFGLDQLRQIVIVLGAFHLLNHEARLSF